MTMKTCFELRSRYNLVLPVSRSAARPCSPGARPRLRHREEEDGRPLRQHHRRTLQGTEGLCVEYFQLCQLYHSDPCRCLKKLTSISVVLILNKTFIVFSCFVSVVCNHTLTFFPSSLPSVPTEEVWSSQARLPGGGVWDGRLPPEFT